MLKSVFDFIVNDVLGKPEIVIGILVAIGYILRKSSGTKIITGAVTAMVGITMLLTGGKLMSEYFKPITAAVNEAYGIKGYIMDSYAMKAATQNMLGDSFALVGYVFIVAFAVNLLIVACGKYTKMHGVFLTGQTGIAQAAAMLWLMIFYFGKLGMNSFWTVLISGTIVGILWSIGIQLSTKPVNHVTNNAGFTIAHNQMFGIWFFSKIARFFGDPEKSNAENLRLPGFLGIFNSNVVAVAILMSVFVGGFMLSLGIDGVQELAGNTNWFVYIIMTGITFSMYMVIILTGVRMFVGELAASFKGIQERLLPNATPGVDVAALLAFGPNSAVIGFIFTTLGTLIGMGILLILKLPIMVLTGFTPLFFDGGPIGVIANKYGGWKAAAACGTILGLIHVFGTIWMIPISGLEDEMGWSGMFDLSTIWPAIVEVFRFIASLLS
ncbi:PTS sugar transporter subunit IIC [Bacillus sp. FJAT-50079]|uniref:PTS sugar transporter subunit IIC n=1 Tax=Bacillus sp. FJAT-50079 TaxID=2833577 RepID=UPI001BC9EC4B|nr:PTS sugar transporter subunit IIC [Bacillus sp. FJAT-50079]MBS4210182.1 PTS sugar transporter subunit IIC [Bacillus sp. FJAT-50079]